MDNFEKAIKGKYRYNSNLKGKVTTEDLYDLDKEQLNSIAIAISRQINSNNDEGFLKNKKVVNSSLSIKLDILKHIISSKEVAEDKAEKRIANKQKADRIMIIIADNEDDELKGKSKEELAELLADLQA